MIPERTFRGMKQTIKVFVSAVHMLLSHKLLAWPDEDYATFDLLMQMSSPILKSNPTREQVMTVLLMWAKFMKSLSERVPVEELKAKSMALYEQAAKPYLKHLEEKTEQ